MADSHSRLSARRRFLFAAGAAAIGTSSAVRIARACSSQATLRVGVLLPPSTRYPELAGEFLGGFEAFAKSDAASGRVEIIPLACSNGMSQSVAAAVRASECRSVDVIAGIASRELAARMSPALEREAVPFVACDLGADIARPRRDDPLPVRHSLGYWQANSAMGPWSATHLGRRAIIAVDFLESGHDIVYAFRRSFEAAGGKVIGVVRTGLPNGPGDFAEVAATVHATSPDFVYALYSGNRATAFLRAYEAQGLARAVPLAGGALLTERGAPAGFEGIFTAASWAQGHAGPFAALGYQSAQRIAAGADAPEGDTFLAEPLRPAYVRRLVRTAAGLEQVEVERLPVTDVARTTVRELRVGLRSGWIHAYLTA